MSTEPTTDDVEAAFRTLDSMVCAPRQRWAYDTTDALVTDQGVRIRTLEDKLKKATDYWDRTRCYEQIAELEKKLADHDWASRAHGTALAEETQLRVKAEKEIADLKAKYQAEWDSKVKIAEARDRAMEQVELLKSRIGTQHHGHRLYEHSDECFACATLEGKYTIWFLHCTWPVVWNTLVYWLHARLAGHETGISFSHKRLWFCKNCDEQGRGS